MKDPERVVHGHEEFEQAIAKSWPESQWLAYVSQLARDEGWRVYHVFEQRAYARRTDKGWPDLQLLRERLVFIETKVFRKDGSRNPLSADQAEVIAMLKSAGQEVCVFWPDQEDEVRRGRRPGGGK